MIFNQLTKPILWAPPSEESSPAQLSRRTRTREEDVINRLPDRHLRRVFLYYVESDLEKLPKIFIGAKKEIRPGNFLTTRQDLEELFSVAAPNGDLKRRSEIKLVAHADVLLKHGRLELKEAFVQKHAAKRLSEFKELTDDKLHDAVYQKIGSMISEEMITKALSLPALRNLALSYFPPRTSIDARYLKDEGIVP